MMSEISISEQKTLAARTAVETLLKKELEK